MVGVVLIRSQLLSKNPSAVIGIAYIKSNSYSTDDRVYNLATLKRGTGGRSSFNGVVATVFGATGFVGRYVCNKLGKIGTQLILPYRGDNYEPFRLKLCGDLGQVYFHPYHLRDEESIMKSIKYSNVVVNLVGRDWETKNFKFDDVHVKGARLLAKCAKQSGVERFIHLSSMNASDRPEMVGLVKGGSKFLISKAEGEQAVLEEFPEATIIRPADIYGQEDRFLRYYAHPWRRWFNYMPLWDKGEKTEKQPVHVSDIAAGIVNAIKDPDSAGKIYQGVGPKRYLLSELVDYFYRVMRKEDEWGYTRYDMKYDPFFQLKISMSEYSPNWPFGGLHWEKAEREYVNDRVEYDVPTLEDLGVTLTHLESQVPWELKPWTWRIYRGLDPDEPQDPAGPPKAIF